MNRISRSVWIAFGFLVLALSWAPSQDASAAALRHGKNFVLPASETIHDDLYAAGSIVDIQGTVDGDLVVTGQTITIGGNVTGDVIAGARDVTISGRVGGTVRAAGNAVTIDGTVGHDVVAGCGTLVIGPHASVGRDVLAGAGNASFGGRISRDVRAGAGSGTFSGSVGGSVYARSKDLRLADGAVLEHDLIYTSRNALAKAPGATVKGRVEQRTPQQHEGKRNPAAPFLGWLRGLMGLLILGALFFLVFAAGGQRSVEALGRAPWQSLGLGAVLAIGLPFAAVFLFLVGLIFGGWWIALGALVLYFFALALGYVVTATFVGRRLLAPAGRGSSGFALALALGLVALGILTAIPFLGHLIGSVAMLFGLGAIAMAWFRARRAERPAAASLT